MRRIVVCAVIFCMLASCSNSRRDQDALTIKDLQKEAEIVEVKPSEIEVADRKDIERSYREFLKQSKQSDLRAQAIRRLADLAIAEGEEKATAQTPSHAIPQAAVDAEDSKRAIKLYSNLLKTYPKDPRNDQVLYQLGNAYELLGQTKNTYAVLGRLVKQFPRSKYALEAHFRRGELAFSLRRFAQAEKAYQKVLAYGEENEFYIKAVSKLGWTYYQQYMYEEALAQFVTLLDIKIGSKMRYVHYLDNNPLFSAGDRELVEDTFRVISLSLFAGEKGSSLSDYLKHYPDKAYEALIFQKLGQLYIDRNRVTDASNIYKRYIALHPKEPQAVLFNIKILEAYEKGRYSKLTLEAKEQFVDQFHFKQSYWRRDETQSLKAQVEPYLKKHLHELAKFYHASAQKTKSQADFKQAEKYYRLFVDIFSDDAKTPGMHFLLAELLMEHNQFVAAAKEYEVTAYKYNDHKKAAEAGYAAILAYAKLEQQTDSQRRKNRWRQRGIDSALRFAERFPEDQRASVVLTKAAQSLYGDKEYGEAITVAYNVLTLSPSPKKSLQLSAWTIVAHSQFEQKNYSDAEIAYRQLLARMPRKDSRRKELKERLAASVYKQGEKMRRQGDEKAAYVQFQRVGKLAPGANISVTAQFDAAASLLAQKQWLAAAQSLNEFRSRNPDHALARKVPEKLYLAYMESKQWSRAAAELENMGRYKHKESERRSITLRAGDLYQKAGQINHAVRMYKTYVGLYPMPLEQAVEIRFKLAQIAKDHKNWRKHTYWLNEVIKADAKGGRGRNDRTRYLGAKAALDLAEPAYQAFANVKLLRPLKKSIKLKKKKMQIALKAYGRAADYKIAEVTTASTYKIAQIYTEFGDALLKSQRPKGLNKAELTQYEVLLEEQAFPFEEKAIKVHETNVKRVTEGLYDDWVRKSYSALGRLIPARYAKYERSEVYVNVLQ